MMSGSKDTIYNAALVLVALAFIVSGMNFLALTGMQKDLATAGQANVSANQLQSAGNASGNIARLDVIPTGIPRIYGAELEVKYDDISANNQQKANETIKKLGLLDTSIQLNSDALKQRYIKITNSISCEYCCGAAAITFSNGEPACGCAHSYAMRGIAKYLLSRHADEFTDAEILEELGKWKTLFFPGIMQQKAQVLKDKGIEFNYINLASNKYRGIEQGATSGSMVGGC